MGAPAGRAGVTDEVTPPDGRLVGKPALRDHVLVDHPALHDEPDITDDADVSEGIAGDRDEVRLEPGRKRADLIGEPQRLGGARGGGDDGIHRGLSAVADPVDELFTVPPMGAGHGVRAEDHFDATVADCAAKRLVPGDARVFHQREALFGVIAAAEKAVLVLDIVRPEQPEVRVEVGAALGHQVMQELAQKKNNGLQRIHTIDTWRFLDPKTGKQLWQTREYRDALQKFINDLVQPPFNKDEFGFAKPIYRDYVLYLPPIHFF